jgi:O-antigen/teichoic acid export membrane protein
MSGTLAHSVGRLRGYLSLVRLRPFDVQTPEGRSHERHRRALLTAMASVFAKAVSILVQFISVPLTIRYLGKERYGLWMTIGSLVSMLGFLDLGVGAGLVGALADADGKQDRGLARRYVTAAVVTLSAVAVVLLLIVGAASPWLPWPRILNVDAPTVVRDGARATIVLLVCFALGMPLSIVQRVQAGLQEGFASSLWASVASLLTLAGVLLAAHYQAGLAWLVVATAGLPLVALLANAAEVFLLRRPYLRPKLSELDRAAVRRIMRQGLMFFVIQIAMVVGYNSDNIVINQILGPEQVTQFAVPMRLFGFIVVLMQMALGPLWAAYGEAAARGDAAWVRRTFNRSLKLSILVSVAPALFLLTFGKPIVQIWTRGEVTPSLALLIALASWAIVMSVCTAQAMFMNGLHVVRLQMICCSIMAVVNIAVSIVLTKWIGVSGVAFGTVVAQTLCVMIPYFLFVPKVLHEVGARGLPPVQ